jgi:hypothetical protein
LFFGYFFVQLWFFMFIPISKSFSSGRLWFLMSFAAGCILALARGERWQWI